MELMKAPVKKASVRRIFGRMKDQMYVDESEEEEFVGSEAKEEMVSCLPSQFE